MDYFLTWRTYGTWLPGDERGWASRHRGANVVGAPLRGGDARILERSSHALAHAPFVLDEQHRACVDEVIRRHASVRAWRLHALNVRTNHVHLVVGADRPPEKVMGECKAWSSRRVRERCDVPERVWARHGSTRYLKTEASFRRAIEYTLHEQD